MHNSWIHMDIFYEYYIVTLHPDLVITIANLFIALDSKLDFGRNFLISRALPAKSIKINSTFFQFKSRLHLKKCMGQPIKRVVRWSITVIILYLFNVWSSFHNNPIFEKVAVFHFYKHYSSSLSPTDVRGVLYKYIRVSWIVHMNMYGLFEIPLIVQEFTKRFTL